MQVNSCCGVHQEVLIFRYLLIAHQASHCQVHINVLGLELDHWHRSLGDLRLLGKVVIEVHKEILPADMPGHHS